MFWSFSFVQSVYRVLCLQLLFLAIFVSRKHRLLKNGKSCFIKCSFCRQFPGETKDLLSRYRIFNPLGTGCKKYIMCSEDLLTTVLLTSSKQLLRYFHWNNFWLLEFFEWFYSWTLRHFKKRIHPSSTYAKFFGKLTFLTHWYAHVRFRIRG